MLSNSKIRTVTGDLPAEQLGHIQCHEHIWLRKGPGYELNPALCMDDYNKSLQELKDYRLAGGATIVDAQPGGFGRDAEKLLRLSKDSGVNIVAVTGFHKKAFAEEDLGALTETALVDRFCREITEGMTECGSAKAGMVKAAWDDGGLEDYVNQKLFSAVAATAAQTGAPVLIHTEKDTDLTRMLKLFEGCGVPAHRILICHLDRTIPDPGLHKEVMAAGCYLCYDSVNRLKYVSHAQELALIGKMCEAGLDERIVLSLDTTAARLRSYGAADMGLDYLLKDYKNMLISAGIPEKSIRKMYETNAAQILCLGGK
ncbi:MAG: TatD family hydrolase [Oscillospiraceae bacterium]|nr:TatD family hydrolase [Oscillospiraceae bacterium]